MTNTIHSLLRKDSYTKEEIIKLLSLEGDAKKQLFTYALSVKKNYIGNKVYYRGLIEFSNICSKNCYYCGIRRANQKNKRYNLSDKEILDAAKFAYENRYGSLVLQGGEVESPAFTKRISNLVQEIKRLSDNKLGITLSLGEQSYDVYKEWFMKGAHRYLLRIESSNKDLYYKIHPQDKKHNFENRLKCLNSLQEIGYQTGTGIMIGLPFQTLEDLANDLIFMKEFDIDMVGMGPYIEHQDTPLYEFRDLLMSADKRFDLTLKMISILRIMMKDINIAAATALQAIDPVGREKAIKTGANIIMPNITPGMYRDNYKLYENKPCTDEEASDCTNCLEIRVNLSGSEVGYNQWGDSIHYKNRLNVKHKN